MYWARRWEGRHGPPACSPRRACRSIRPCAARCRQELDGDRTVFPKSARGNPLQPAHPSGSTAAPRHWRRTAAARRRWRRASRDAGNAIGPMAAAPASCAPAPRARLRLRRRTLRRRPPRPRGCRPRVAAPAPAPARLRLALGLRAKPALRQRVGLALGPVDAVELEVVHDVRLDARLPERRPGSGRRLRRRRRAAARAASPGRAGDGVGLLEDLVEHPSVAGTGAGLDVRGPARRRRLRRAPRGRWSLTSAATRRSPSSFRARSRRRPGPAV